MRETKQRAQTAVVLLGSAGTCREPAVALVPPQQTAQPRQRQRQRQQRETESAGRSQKPLRYRETKRQEETWSSWRRGSFDSGQTILSFLRYVYTHGGHGCKCVRSSVAHSTGAAVLVWHDMAWLECFTGRRYFQSREPRRAWVCVHCHRFPQLVHPGRRLVPCIFGTNCMSSN